MTVYSQTITTPPSLATTRVGDDATLTCRVSGDGIVLWREHVTKAQGEPIYDTKDVSISHCSLKLQLEFFVF